MSGEVRIVTFPETRVASISHAGPAAQEHETARKLVAWKLANGFTDQARYRQYGLHYVDIGQAPGGSRVDFCLSVDSAVGENPHGIIEKTIPSLRCALARDVGSRLNNQAARYLFEQWLPRSGEQLAGFPLIFHYVNVGPNVKEQEAITDVYMPLR
jgi:AraC family transcriptional regulator